jgi:ADP-heptose:LPS heptosyltransferase
MKIIKKFLSLIRLLTVKFIDLVIASVGKKQVDNKLLLIRLDAIGDYVLFRNFIAELKRSEKYGNHKITLVGNQAWSSLAETLDAEFIERFIWLDRQKLIRNPVYRVKKLLEIRAIGFDVVISPVFSREFLLADSIVQVVSAKEKIGSVGDLSNIKAWQKRISNKWYTRLVTANQDLMFEFDRNKEFFRNLLGRPIDFYKPMINKHLLPDISRFYLPDSFAVIFIGASASFRKWPIDRFAELANHLYKRYKLSVVLCGGPGDREDLLTFKESCSVPFIDLVGQTTLVELVAVLSKAVVLVSNETSAPHFAVAVDVKTIFVVSNGNHFGRFTPYPVTVFEQYHVVFHPAIKNRLLDFEGLCRDYGFGSVLPIQDIDVLSLLTKIDQVLGSDVNDALP